MAAISIEDVKRLRERSGCGWIACRDALTVAEGYTITGLSREDIALELLPVNRASSCVA